MSKKSNKKNKKKNIKLPKKKKFNYKSLAIWLSVFAAAALVLLCSYIVYLNTSPEAADFVNIRWSSEKAYDASSDEVDMYTVYNNKYNNYQGSMELKGDGGFTFWMNVGDPNDGTHSGRYSYDRDKQKINAVFDNGQKAVFKIVRNDDNKIDHIEVPYEGYTVWFYNK